MVRYSNNSEANLRGPDYPDRAAPGVRISNQVLKVEPGAEMTSRSEKPLFLCVKMIELAVCQWQTEQLYRGLTMAKGQFAILVLFLAAVAADDFVTGPEPTVELKSDGE